MSLKSLFTDIANSIRVKKGTTTPIRAVDFAKEIESIDIGIKVEEIETEDITVTPKTTQQVINRSEDKYINKVTVEAVTNSIDSNITSENIKKGVSILGIVGALESGGSGGGAVNGLQWKCDNMKTLYNEFFNYKGYYLDEPLSNLDTSQVTDWSSTFSSCTNISTIPYINTSSALNTSNMFASCSKLTSVPNLNLNNVTNAESMFKYCQNMITSPEISMEKCQLASYMFQRCQSLTTVPKLTTSESLSNATSMFSYCYVLTDVPLFETKKVTNMSYMFQNCYAIENIPEFDTSSLTNASNMFNGCRKIKTIPLLNTSKVTNASYMFSGCYELTTVPALDFSSVTNLDGAFNSCNNLKSILATGIKVNFNIVSSSNFEREDLVTILNNLATVTNNRSINMGTTNLLKLTDEDKAIATAKGWTLT